MTGVVSSQRSRPRCASASRPRRRRNVAAAERPTRRRSSAGSSSMRKQIEGSQAVAETVARCRPEVICGLPDLAADPHRRGALRPGRARASSTPCEYLMVESEFGAMSACIGASAAGARAYTATASQGLLFMAEALSNASGLGLPIVMTVANRAIGAPINIWNDHSDAMSQRDCGWIQLFAESNQEAVDLHVQAFRARRGAVRAGDGVHGRLRPDARRRGDRRPDAGAGRRLPAAVRAAPGARPRRARSRSARWSGPRRSPRCSYLDAREADAGARR